ncbi:MAG: NAD-dependent epimerase/dehydratase family protein [Sphaerochaetaceae bacterium]|jgi:UDP-glucuronate decarboxylase
MQLLENRLYTQDLTFVSKTNLPWEELQNSHILITGSTGLLGSFLIDVLMTKNRDNLQCHVYAMGRSKERAMQRFSQYVQSPYFTFIAHDINDELKDDKLPKFDYILHLASNTHPVAYSTQPVETITTNIIGTHNLLMLAKRHNSKRFLLSSSVEVYGMNRGDTLYFDELYSGHIDCNTLRAGYPESKRCSEALCQAYIRQHNLDIVIARLARCYGPTLRTDDSKALSQFLFKALRDEDIVLKSEGLQHFSYLYVADAISALLTILLLGKNGEAYNIADEQSDVLLKDLATTVANSVGRNVIFEIPNSTEQIGYSTANIALLNSAKLRQLGWSAHYSISQGVERTIKILKSTQGK